MIWIRLVSVIAVFGVVGYLLAWMLTGNLVYRKRAKYMFYIMLALLLAILLMFFISRLLTV